jgi:hypothetical protein
MKLRDVLTVLGTAAVTAAVALVLLAPRGDGNAQAAPSVKPFISQPQLTSQGCTFTLETDKTAYEAGESPVIKVTAANATEKTVTASVWVGITATSPVSRMSRMLPIPTSLWTHEYAFTLPPGETKTIEATCEAKLAAGQNVGIVLTDKKEAILAAGLGISAQVQQAQQVQDAINNTRNAVPPAAHKP